MARFVYPEDYPAVSNVGCQHFSSECCCFIWPPATSRSHEARPGGGRGMTTRRNLVRTRIRNRNGNRFPWNQLTDEQLLDMRICDLPLKIKGSFLEPHIKRLYSELNERGIRFKPHVWLSEEWFSPDRVP